MNHGNARTQTNRQAGRGGQPQARTWHPRNRFHDRWCIRELPKKQRNWRWLPVVLVLLLPYSAPAQQAADIVTDISPAQMQSGSLLLRMRSGYAIATRMDTAIDARVSGLVARVTVRQSFRNDGQQWVEGIYVFPLPDTAAVDRLSMHIGERVIEGEIREKEAAKKEFETAKKAGKRTSLVEQHRTNIFTTSVANIGPGETIVVEIEYLETLRYDEGLFSIRFPLTITPRYIPGAPLAERKGSGWSADTTHVADASLITPPVVIRSTNHKLSFSATIDAGVPLASIESRYHPIDVRDESGHHTLALANPDAPLDHDLELAWRPVPDSAPRAAVFSETSEGRRHLLIMVLPPDDMSAPVAPMPRELIFVIDTSGSMHGTSLGQASRALLLALDGLAMTDRFNVIQFNSVTSALFPGSVPATSGNVRTARQYVSRLQANGGTEMRPAINLALDYPPVETHLRQVIFITDGSVGNEEELFGLIERKLGKARLFTVGIGSAPNSWFMRKAAEAGHGTFTLISAVHEVNEKMGRLFRTLEQPQITDIVIEWPAGMSIESYPGTIADLYAGEPIVIRSRLDGEQQRGALLKISGNSMLGTWARELSVDTGVTSPGVAALWARARIGDLMDRERRGASHDDIRKAVIDTALAHKLVSRYTSLVAVDKTPARPQHEGLGREQVANLLPHGQSMNAIFGFPATATNAGLYRLNGMLLLAAALLLMLLTGWGRRHRDALSNR